MTLDNYLQMRANILRASEQIIATEHAIMQFLAYLIQPIIPRIVEDFNQAIQFMPFWIHYAPLQRGRAPTGTGIPWSEVGETAIGANITAALGQYGAMIRFPGLPSGADLRFTKDQSLIHFDVKVTGPNDRVDEIVASPNQISGDGRGWDNGVLNSSVSVQGQRATMQFQPELPPFYILNGQPYLCLTYFLKAVYTVESLGQQPLTYIELISVPNGLLLFDGPFYAATPGLLIPGKDEKTHSKKRVRVRMEPLAKLATWRREILWSAS